MPYTAPGLAFGKASITLQEVANELNSRGCVYLEKPNHKWLQRQHAVVYWVWCWTEYTIINGHTQEPQGKFKVVRYEYSSDVNYHVRDGVIEMYHIPEDTKPRSITFIPDGVRYVEDLVHKVYLAPY